MRRRLAGGGCALLALVLASGTRAAALSQPQYGIRWDRDVIVTVRDGTRIATDVIRPDAEGRFPVLVSSSPYQKDLERVLPKGPPYSHRETLSPEFFVTRGYVLVRADARGTGKSAGTYPGTFSKEEARDVYDVIAWAAKQPWSNGKVGMGGVSYYAILQYNVASLQPPALAAIVPWEGASDIYRDGVYHGGLLNTGFLSFWWSHVRARQLLEWTVEHNPQAMKLDAGFEALTHPLDGPYWRERAPDFDRITVPMYSVGNWEGIGLHLRGNVEAFVRARSPHKKLRIHTGSHTGAFYSEEGQTDMLRWYDTWLKGIDTGILQEPPVKYRLPGAGDDAFRTADGWPIPGTEHRRLYLHSATRAKVVEGSLNDGMLLPAPPETSHVVKYDGFQGTYAKVAMGRPVVTYVTEPLPEDTEVTGHANLVLWVSSASEGLDLFVKLRDQAPDGRLAEMSKGWLKASYRKLDPALSRPDRPYYAADEEQPLEPGKVYRVEVEIWPTSRWVRQGHRIRIDLAPHDSVMHDFPHFHYDHTYRLAENRIHEGGDSPSHLRLPVVPRGEPGGTEAGRVITPVAP